MLLDKPWKHGICYIIAQFHSSQFLCQESKGKELIESDMNQLKSVHYTMYIISSKESRMGSQYFRLCCPTITLTKLEIEHDFVKIIFCCRNHYIILGNHIISSEVCWTSKKLLFIQKMLFKQAIESTI